MQWRRGGLSLGLDPVDEERGGGGAAVEGAHLGLSALPLLKQELVQEGSVVLGAALHLPTGQGNVSRSTENPSPG